MAPSSGAFTRDIRNRKARALHWTLSLLVAVSVYYYRTIRAASAPTTTLSAHSTSTTITSALLAFFCGYLVHYFDGSERQYDSGGRYWESFQRLSWWSTTVRCWLAKESSIYYEDEQALSNCKQGILAMAPHGVMSLSHYMVVTNSHGFRDAWPAPRRELAASVLFRLPILREFCLWTGNVRAR